MTRSFKDSEGRTAIVPHRCYDFAAQKSAAAAAGLTLEAVHEVRVGFELSEPFANSEAFYHQWHGLPVVLIVRARKPA
jgi:hypothetical protein